jgi:hypothetical protein
VLLAYHARNADIYTQTVASYSQTIANYKADILTLHSQHLVAQARILETILDLSRAEASARQLTQQDNGNATPKEALYEPDEHPRGKSPIVPLDGDLDDSGVKITSLG